MSVVAMDLWDVERAAKYLGVSPDWLYKAARAGIVPCVRINRLVRFCPRRLEAWVVARSGTSAVAS